ncbi:hypothetical protein D6T64_11620 [Cryobacterium melibiosiphilum]|uniref:SnoaL-like domain-containing protein n=1 Tax=Cryobacterium melibiosiphilum TaxID=995039 RepID=A0A3A5MMC1_9MICO|nr:hypothetical protein D6T64_11620 [Cryobacterium melibiosiphilum]
MWGSARVANRRRCLQVPVTRAFDALVAAAADQDVDAFVALYEDDVIVCDSWGQWGYAGQGA